MSICRKLTDDTLPFLGTMAGEQSYINGTYCRMYQSFGFSDDTRLDVSKAGNNNLGLGYKSFGEEYSFTPWSLSDGRNFGHKPTSRQGGGFFLTVKDFSDRPERGINCFAYALGTFGEELESLAGQSMEDIQESVSRSIDHIVDKYFKCVEEIPKDGDLAVYQSISSLITPGSAIIPPNTTTHAGVYRKSEPNWNSPFGGTVESKWGWLGNPYVFQHDVFFVPNFYGDLVKFYRLKETIIEEENSIQSKNM